MDRLNALYLVDIMTPGGVPSPTWPNYIPHHWIRSLKEIEAMDLDFIISGHGVPIAHASSVTERRTYVEMLVNSVRTANERGLTGDARVEFVRKELQPVSHLRRFDLLLDKHVARIAQYWYIGW